MKLGEFLNEAMRVWQLASYKSVRKDGKKYKLHDLSPKIVILDPHFSFNYNEKKPRFFYLAFNLHYLSQAQIKEMLTSVQKYDDKYIDKIKTVEDIIGGFLGEAVKRKHDETVNKYLKRMLGFYSLDKENAITRYRRLVKKWPFLLKIIRAYSYKGINQD